MRVNIPANIVGIFVGLGGVAGLFFDGFPMVKIEWCTNYDHGEGGRKPAFALVDLFGFVAFLLLFDGNTGGFIVR